MLRSVTIAIVLCLAGAAALPAQPPDPPLPAAGDGDDGATPAAFDDSTPEYRRALELQRKGRFLEARRAFRRILETWPDSAHRDDIETRSADNAFLGVEALHVSGPSERRIDVTVMGDGFTIDSADQNLEEKWAKLCLSVLWNEGIYDEYRDYFNFYFARLASLEEGVDPNLSPEERARIEARNRTRTRKRKTDYSTALDCKASGPQGQVMADRSLVYRWLGVAARDLPGCEDDALVIAFARFGVLGMGGGGIANVGRPDKSVTVHEFGHSFGGLLDEYAINPMTPRGEIRAANAATTGDPERVPWAHFLRKKVPGVGVFEGGATYVKGVWRPARACAMNSAGNNQYCPVCREAAILRIYSYVSPIDASAPDTGTEVTVTEGAEPLLAVTPMRPRKHRLEVAWHVQPIDASAPGPETLEDEPRPTASWDQGMSDHFAFRAFRGGRRRRGDRSALDTPPAGALSTLGQTRKLPAGSAEHVFPPGRLKPGRYRVTAVVHDPTPRVLLDPRHLLEERLTWTVTVRPRS